MSHKQNLDMGWRRDGKGERGGGEGRGKKATAKEQLDW